MTTGFHVFFSANSVLAQIFIKDVVNEGEDLELDELNNSGSSSQRQKQQSQGALGDIPATSHQQLMHSKANNSPTSAPPSPPEEAQKAEKNGDPTKEAHPAPVVAKAFQTQALPNGKTQTSVKTMNMNKRKISQQKEKKATQMLAIVLGKALFVFYFSSAINDLWIVRVKTSSINYYLSERKTWCKITCSAHNIKPAGGLFRIQVPNICH